MQQMQRPVNRSMQIDLITRPEAGEKCLSGEFLAEIGDESGGAAVTSV